jgi:cytidylate kinase
MAIVTITRGLHSGGEKLAESIAQKLGARCVSSEVLREAAKTYNVPEEKLSDVFESAPTFWERMTESRRVYLAYVQAQLAEWARDDHLVYHGNAGQELLREAPHALKVRIMVPIEERVRIIMQRFNFDHDKAAQYVEKIDDDRTRRMRYFYNTDWRDSRRYDLTINLGRVTMEAAEEIILGLLQRPEFRLSEATAPAFNDFLIKSRVHALLAGALVGRLSLITVTVTQGVVRLQGTLTSNEAVIEQLVDQVRQLPGVKAVNNEIVVGLVYQEWNV